MERFLIVVICLLILSARPAGSSAHRIAGGQGNGGNQPHEIIHTLWQSVDERDSYQSPPSTGIGHETTRQHLSGWPIGTPSDTAVLALAPEALAVTGTHPFPSARNLFPDQLRHGRAPIPEPTTLLLLGSALCGIAIWLRRPQR